MIVGELSLFFLSFSLPLALVERKREEAARREEADLKRKKAMELEEAFRDGCKARGIPREVNTL